jgi:hypothetical protein
VKGAFYRHGEHWLIFDCGSALVLSSNSSFWTAAPDEVGANLEEIKEKLAQAGITING